MGAMVLEIASVILRNNLGIDMEKVLAVMLRCMDLN